jgi:hypothetical protein
MAFEEDVLDVALLTTTDLSAAQYCFVKLTAAGTVGICSGTTDNIIGVLQNKPVGTVAVPNVARVRVYGVSRIFAATSALTYGSLVGTDASGHGVVRPVTAPGDKGVFFGICTESTTTSGQTATVLCLGRRQVVTA